MLGIAVLIIDPDKGPSDRSAAFPRMVREAEGMARFLGILLFTCVLAVPVRQALAAELRVALIVGIGNYETVPRLPNAAGDAEAMAEMFRQIGFDVVTTRTDVGNLALKRAVRDFEDSAAKADIAVIYYAGHGIEVADQNYLVPADAKLADERDIDDEAVNIDRLIGVLEPAKKLRLLILDACRSNPFVGKMKRRVVTRSISPGLGVVEPTSSNTLIAYAAKARTVANDGGGHHSPFTQALLNNIAIPGLDIRIALGKVRDEVLLTTGGQQEPYVYGSLGGSTVALVPEAPLSAEGNTLQGASDQRAKDDFELARGIGSKEAYSAFLRRYQVGLYADLARAQLTHLDADQSSLNGKATMTPLSESAQAVNHSSVVGHEAWEALKDSTDMAAIRKFIRQFPTSNLLPVATKRLEILRRSAREREVKANPATVTTKRASAVKSGAILKTRRIAVLRSERMAANPAARLATAAPRSVASAVRMRTEARSPKSIGRSSGEPRAYDAEKSIGVGF